MEIYQEMNAKSTKEGINTIIANVNNLAREGDVDIENSNRSGNIFTNKWKYNGRFYLPEDFDKRRLIPKDFEGSITRFQGATNLLCNIEYSNGDAMGGAKTYLEELIKQFNNISLAFDEKRGMFYAYLKGSARAINQIFETAGHSAYGFYGKTMLAKD